MDHDHRSGIDDVMGIFGHTIRPRCRGALCITRSGFVTVIQPDKAEQLIANAGTAKKAPKPVKAKKVPVALRFNVSAASVHNWVTTGYLLKAENKKL